MEIKDVINDYREYIDNTIREFEHKIENINDSYTLDKISQIKDKAATVLNRVYNKVVDLAKELSEKDIEELIAHAYKKSTILVNDANNKIDAYIEDYKQNNGIDLLEIKPLKQNKYYEKVENKVNALIDNIMAEDNKEETKIKIEEVISKENNNEDKTDTICISDKALSTLNEWLKPEKEQ